ncbi:hypothetical protein M406DRAFT_293212 [Cryphonectria parasitica EP155]|uniref:Extracelular serine carboxypeptidase n=1 Tax=Cryphonectria parasitica (strain ATCC 38755 / EP155) TaxID=660469 RepID=A0A9P4XZ73_CRYP1|nr:uncharacterized protein M406DRAFT_293212 [Cryphonectria parasitica EP155]KAF3763604.1 hypothetical protein M406DRAFT_293212 [Cryphonectria parasitica EP155]
MHAGSFSLVLLLAGLSGLVSARGPLRRRQQAAEIQSRDASASSSYTYYTFQQPIDHFPDKAIYAPHTNATFAQRYVFDASYYKPGGPVFLYVGGETFIEERLEYLETGIIQILMNATGGLGTIADFAYFAQHASFEGINATLTAPSTPWIMYGGSLAGAQTAFTVKTYGDIIYGGIASSQIVNVSVEYPEWYNPVQKYAPSDCVTSINDIVDKFDGLLAANNTAAVAELKAIFGLELLTDDRDFAKTINYPIGNPFDYPTSTWQELIWTDEEAQFWEFCGAVTDLDAPANVTAVDEQMAKYTGGEPWTNLGNYANYIKQVILPTCPSGHYASGECFGQGNATWWTELVDPGTRAYIYTTCYEAGLYQAAPKQGKTLLSRVLTGAYTQEICELAFPPGQYNTIPASPQIDLWNGYGGFGLSADRLALVDGQQDPWLDTCYHATDAPPRYSSDLHPEYLIEVGGHHWDSSGILDIPGEPQFIRQVHWWEIKTVRKWLRDFSSWVPENSSTLVR